MPERKVFFSWGDVPLELPLKKNHQSHTNTLGRSKILSAFHFCVSKVSIYSKFWYLVFAIFRNTISWNMFAKLVAFHQNEWVGWLWDNWALSWWLNGWQWLAGGWHAQGLLVALHKLQSLLLVRKFWNPDDQTLNLCLLQPDPQIHMKGVSLLSSCLFNLSPKWPNLDKRLQQNSEKRDSQQRVTRCLF